MAITINNGAPAPTGNTVTSGKGGISNAKQYTVTGDNSGDTIKFGTNTADNNLSGGTGNDVITAGSGRNHIFTGGGNDTIKVGNGTNYITVDGAGNNTITVGNGANSIAINFGGSDTLNLGSGANQINVGDPLNNPTAAITATINGLSTGHILDILTSTATVTATVSKAWTADSQTINDGVATLTTHGAAINLANAGGDHGWTLISQGTIPTTLTGSELSDTFKITKGSATITNLSGGDALVTSATTHVTAAVSSNWTATNASNLAGTETLNLSNGVSADLHLATVTKGLTISGAAGNDTIIGSDAGETIKGGKGDILTGGLGSDVFSFSKGTLKLDVGGITANTLNTITDYKKGAVGTGDSIHYSSALKIGGSDIAVSVNSSTGVATFTTTPANLAAAENELASAFHAKHQGNGAFAFFKFDNAEYLYISSANHAAGATSHDNLIQLVGVDAIGGINLHGANLTITS